MSDDRILRIFLEPSLKYRAEAGDHNFINKIADVARLSGLAVEFCGNSLSERTTEHEGYSLYHMSDPTGPRSLTFRRAYHYPFWQIESGAKRWEWRSAKTPFDDEAVNPDEARRFYKFWQKRLFGDALGQISHDGLVYVPLQGRLSERRSFQTCSPMEMLAAVLQHDPVRRVFATLHPNEVYSASELAGLDALCARFPRLSLQTGGMEEMLARCDYVVTQNSSAAFNGYFFGKPCILFARVDFHHIAANVFDLGRDEAFRAMSAPLPDFAAYLWWFWQEMSINAGRPEAEHKIHAALRRGGWPI
ncbi:hypothetical protein SAMN04488092_11527 [Thalassovita taeanensis]|uniref:Capsule polysaccharide biosynthesis protein n=2 Tax=Thalassovita taeanensis TaxID=657014 RepID=A0A1H9JIB9_9RHOB|nr:hypothetical protein SAMN04488092_11527 [Thalassovita taeanensis]